MNTTPLKGSPACPKGNHWASRYIGLKWVSGGRGPIEFDCWGLLVYAYLNKYGLKLPDYPIAPEARGEVSFAIAEATRNSHFCTRIETPVDGCAVLMGNNHVGLWIDVDGGLILHADKPRVRAESLQEVRQTYRKIQFYRHNGLNP